MADPVAIPAAPAIAAPAVAAPAVTAPHRVNAIALDHLGYGLHRDDYTVTDQLDRRALVRAIAEVLAKDTPPQVFGLHGDWGSGKTSTLRAIRYQLTGDDTFGEKPQDLDGGLHSGHVVTVWFEAWRYQNETAPIVALIQEIRRELSRAKKIKSEAGKLGTVAVSALLDSLDKAAKLVGWESAPMSPQRIQSIGEQWEKEHYAATLQTDSVQDVLTQAITNLLPPQRKGFPTPRVVVFIDDLDRCSAEAAFRLLEGLKIYLNLKNCVFVLGMNQQVVTEAIAERLKKDDRDAAVLLRAEAYLEKLCSNIWRLPLPQHPLSYFIGLVDNPDARAALAKARIPGPGQAPGPSFLPPNPRRLRALANVYNRLRHQAVNDTYTSDINLRLLVVSYVYQFHSELFQRWHYDTNFFNKMRTWSSSGTADEKTEPYFSRLSLPTQLKVDTTSPTPGGGGVESRFPDPAAPGIFWIAPLLQQPPLSNAVAEEFRALLLIKA